MNPSGLPLVNMTSLWLTVQHMEQKFNLKSFDDQHRESTCFMYTTLLADNFVLYWILYFATIFEHFVKMFLLKFSLSLINEINPVCGNFR